MAFVKLVDLSAFYLQVVFPAKVVDVKGLADQTGFLTNTLLNYPRSLEDQAMESFENMEV